MKIHLVQFFRYQTWELLYDACNSAMEVYKNRDGMKEKKDYLEIKKKKWGEAVWSGG